MKPSSFNEIRPCLSDSLIPDIDIKKEPAVLATKLNTKQKQFVSFMWKAIQFRNLQIQGCEML